MATPSARGQQAQLTVNVWFDRSTNRVHLASTDPDLGLKGLHTNIKPALDAG